MRIARAVRVGPQLAGGLLAAMAWTGFAAEADERIEIVEVVAPLDLDAGAANAAGSSANIQTASAEEIAARRALDLADYMKRNLASVFVNEAQSNPLQPDVQYRGFVGSPLLGLPQGLAVYQDAVRINEPFGDTVNWALIPKSAIDSIFLVPGSNPLFGLNALGGALSIRTKNGFSHPGTSVELSAGSFGRRSLSMQTGGGERIGYFATASTLREDGWRDFSPTDATQGFVKLGWRGARASLDFSLTLAATDLVGNGAAPVELLAIEPTAVFTRPDRTRNELAQFNLVGRLELAGGWLLRGNLHVRNSDIDSYNGDDSDFEDCEEEPEFLCLENEQGVEYALDRSGRRIPASEDLAGATINRTRTGQNSGGFGIEADWTSTFGARGERKNRLVAGLAWDAGDIGFRSSTELGALDETRLAIPGGIHVGDAFTGLGVAVDNASFYLFDAVELRSSLRLTAAIRYNRVDVALRDELGTALDGDHRFQRVNPSLGVVYRASPGRVFYAGYSESNRAPSPVELTCADEDAPCRLPNAFLADPPLDQVTARTLEIGVRGSRQGFDWRTAIFQTRNDDDILFISAGASTNQGFFDNVGGTRREGVELSLQGGADTRLRWFVHATFLRTLFEHGFVVPSAHHPEATDGEIAVRPGSSLPLIPRRLLKAGLAIDVTARLVFGAEVLHGSRQHFRGDEANLAPAIDGHATVNLRIDYRLHDQFSVFATIDNALDEDYATFGVFGEVDDVLGDDFEDNRFISPAPPRGAWVGVEARF